MDKNIANACEGEAADHVNVPAVTGQKKEVKTSCSNCPHQAEVQAGKYRDVKFADTPCGTCDWKEASSTYTREYDDERITVQEAEKMGEYCPAKDEAPEPELMLPSSILGEALKGFMTLPELARDVVCRRFNGEQYRSIAESKHLTVGAVENAHRRALQSWPHLRYLFPRKSSKVKHRRRPGGPRRAPAVRPGGPGYRRCGHGFVRSTYIDSETNEN